MNDRNESLDLIRGLAALFVMLGHLRSIFFVPYQELVQPNIVYKVFYFLTGYGHECVIIFFVLSGYFVSAAFIRKLSSAPLEKHCKSYALNRLTRLWVVLIPALLLTVALDYIGSCLTTIPAVYTSPDYFQFIHPTNDRSITTFIGNVFFIQTVLVPTFGTNTPLWSLANEFWYYLLFPLIYLLFVPFVTPKQKVIAVVGLTVIGVFLYLNNVSILEGFIIWLIGYLAYYFSGKKTNTLLRWAATAFFIFIFILIRAKPFANHDYVLGATTGLLIMTIGTIRLSWINNLGVYLSKISYTLYLIHLPIIIFIKAVFFPELRLKNSMMHVLLFIGLVLLIIALSHGMFFFFERNTDKIKAVIKKKLFAH